MPKPVSPTSTVEVVARPEHDRRLRRRFSAEDKRHLLQQAEACTERGQLAAWWRRERLYSSPLATWRTQLKREGEAGREAKPPARPALRDAQDRRIEALEREKAQLERRRLIAEKLIELQAQERGAMTESGGRP